MGRIDRRARVWLAEILYGLITGDYRRVAEIHFEAQYVPAHHSVDEFATALRAAGEPIRGLPVKEISVGRMLESLFSITRDFDMNPGKSIAWPVARSTTLPVPSPSSTVVRSNRADAIWLASARLYTSS